LFDSGPKKKYLTTVVAAEPVMWRMLFFFVFLAPLTLGCSIVAIIGTLFHTTGAFAHGCARFWSRVSLALAGVKLTVSGLDRVPVEGPVIYMGNHQGNFDILALTLAIPRRFSWLAKEELFRVPFFGGAMRRAGYIPLDRSDGRRALKSIDAAARTIREGVSVVVFPEGTRTHDGNLLPFKKGGFILATRAAVPVVPFTINGSMNINPRNRFELHPGTISITFFEPLLAEGTGNAARDTLLEQVRAAITRGLHER
jgi:1-acyl-sn-glycerol-3-phosphate acyltransferase